MTEIKQEDNSPSPPKLPPPSSQSHFATFDNFAPDDAAPFDDEFARLAATQNWVPGSQEYTQERTIAMREEIKTLYFSQSQPLADIPEALTPDQVLEGYHALCDEVGIERPANIGDCKRELKKNLVNIIDLIDARRTGKEIKIWTNFEEFSAYTIQDGHRIDKEEAKKDGGFLASLLQRLGGPRKRTRRRKGRGSKPGQGVVSGRVIKRTPP